MTNKVLFKGMVTGNKNLKIAEGPVPLGKPGLRFGPFPVPAIPVTSAGGGPYFFNGGL